MSDNSILPSWVYQPCPAGSAAHREAARARQDQLTKPTGALGRLETLAIELASLQHSDRPRAERVPIIVFAGDHGIAVSASVPASTTSRLQPSSRASTEIAAPPAAKFAIIAIVTSCG